MRGKFNRTIVAADTGAVVPYARVEVLEQVSGDPAVLFSVESGGTPIANPVEASNLGLVSFFVEAGQYRFIARSVGGVFVSEITHELVIDPETSTQYSSFAEITLSDNGSISGGNGTSISVYSGSFGVVSTIGITNLVYDIALLTGTAHNLTYSNIDNSFMIYRTTNASAKTYTVRPNADHAVPVGAAFNLRNVGAGLLTIVEGSGVTINAPSGGTLTVAQGGSVTLICVDEDEYDLIGQVVAA